MCMRREAFVPKKILKIIVPLAGAAVLAVAALADTLPPDATYRSLPTLPLGLVRANDEAEKPQVEQRQQALLEERYDLADRPIPNVMMSGTAPKCSTLKYPMLKCPTRARSHRGRSRLPEKGVRGAAGKLALGRKGFAGPGRLP